jgi:diaminohydroxyphosphoribosylaminopyrimidine deaminase / 5-amino-6-(5-phosphoribosylamino)uracil reductase
MAADDDRRHMARALELAQRGEGHVEPNPMVGCVLVRDGSIVGEGWHRQFGGPHAEVEALRAAGDAARGATAYVTLEPCAHTGKTPPCTQALLQAGVSRVVVASRDPNPRVAGGGLEHLAAAGAAVESGLLASDGASLIAPFQKLVTRGLPWVIAKWAMTLDGKLATHAGDSRWISGEASRAIVHQLRGRVDAIMVGRATVVADDPLLTARPAGTRTAVRIILDSQASLSPESQLVRTCREAPVLVAASDQAPAENCRRLREGGVELWQSAAPTSSARLAALLEELGRRQMTNILIEGGAQVLGSLFDLQAVDEIHAFVAPMLIGGAGVSPIAGAGRSLMAEAARLAPLGVERVGDDAYIHGRLES